MTTNADNPQPDLSEFTIYAEFSELQEAYSRLQQQHSQLKKRGAQLVRAAFDGAHDALLGLGVPGPVAAPPKDKRRKREEVALWHLTDWQGAKETETYNTAVMRERVMRFVEKARELTERQRADHPVKRCVILFGGDMAEGLFNFPAQPFEIDATLFKQYVEVAKLEAEVVREALAIYETVEVYQEWGNHGRIGSKRATVPPEDNFDRFSYELARALVGEQPRLKWEDSKEDIHPVEIGNYRALLIHGDEIGRNGYASANTIVQHVTKWKSGSYKINGKHWHFRDAYMGHYHTHAEWPLPDGEGSVYQTGSPESDNRFAGTMMASQATPSQRVHFVDPEKGRVSAVYKVWLQD